MRVTINTDASYNDWLKRGSYAYWIVSDAGKICNTGILRRKIKDNTEAELRAILLAFNCLVEKSEWKDITSLIINTDNMFCVSNLNKLFAGEINFDTIKRNDLNIYFYHFRHLLKKLPGAKFEVRHVKAHESTDTKRQYVNDWCDQNAKATLKQYVKKEKLQTTTQYAKAKRNFRKRR